MTLIGTIVVGYVFELSAWFPYMLFFSAALPLSLLIYYSIREKRIMAKRNYRKMKWVRPIAIGIYYSNLRFNGDSFGFCANHKISIAPFIKTNL